MELTLAIDVWFAMLNTSSTYGAWKIQSKPLLSVADFHAHFNGWFCAPPDTDLASAIVACDDAKGGTALVVPADGRLDEAVNASTPSGGLEAQLECIVAPTADARKRTVDETFRDACSKVVDSLVTLIWIRDQYPEAVRDDNLRRRAKMMRNLNANMLARLFEQTMSAKTDKFEAFVTERLIDISDDEVSWRERAKWEQSQDREYTEPDL